MTSSRFWKDPVLLLLLGTGLGLALLDGGLIAVFGRGRLLGEWPAFIPTMHGSIALGSACIAFLAFGRYRALRDPTFFWIGIGYGGFGVAVAFYILAWPELLPGGRSLIARLDSTSAWIVEFAQTFLVLAILVALLFRWPAEQHLRGRRWLGAVAGALGLVALACAMIAWNEERFPPLVAGSGLYTLLIQLWVAVLIILVAAEGILTARRYLARNELFLGYLAVGLLAFDFCLASAVLGTQRYDLLFYLSRAIGVYAVLVTLFGLLTEFPLLLHRERESLVRVATEREWFQTTLASIGDAVITTDAQGRVSYLNAVAEGLTGWRNQEASGLPVERVFKIVNEQTTQPASNPVEMVLQEGVIAGLTNHTALMTKGGLAVPIEDSAAPISGMPGRVLGVVLVFHDVSEKRKAERALMESEARFRILADSNPSLIWVTDARGNNQFVNRTYCKYFGITPDQAEGGQWQPIIHPDDRAEFEAAVKRAVEAQTAFTGELRVQRKDGAWRWLASCGEPRFSTEGEFLGHVGNSTDITDRQVSEEETRARTVQIELQRRLLDQREQERLQIARDLHDGPVQELTGATLVLQGLLLDQSNPEIAEQLEALKATLQDQIKELRDYAGVLRPPTLSKFGIAKAIQSYLDAFQEKCPSLKVQFVAAQSGEGIRESIGLALFRICQEALNNAAKHAQATEGMIRLEIAESQVSLEIQDNGRGFEVPADWLEQARQGHLGLVGMRERAEAVGGRVEVHSQPGRGTQIQVVVPLQDQQTASKDDLPPEVKAS